MAKSKKIKIDFPIPLPFESEEFAAAWNKWLAYRREKNLPGYKPIGLECCFERLKEESGGDEQKVIDAIKWSMSQNWQGIFFKNVQNGIRTTAGLDTKGTSKDRFEALRNWGG